MADLRTQFAARAADAVQIDEGLRKHMLKVYNYMATGVLLTFVVAWAVAQSPALYAVVASLGWIVLLAAIGWCSSSARASTGCRRRRRRPASGSTRRFSG